MDAYALTLLALATAMLTQAIASGVTLELYLRRGQALGMSRIWLAFSVGTLLLALHHGYTLELALRTGLYDLRQAILAALGGVCLAIAAWGLRRRES